MKTATKLLLVLGVSASSLSAATLLGTSFDYGADPMISGGGILINGVAATPGTANANFGYFNVGFNVASAVAADDRGGLFANFRVISTADVGSTTSTFGSDYAGLFDSGAGAFVTDASNINQTIYGLYTGGSSFSAESIANGYALINSGQIIIADEFPPASYVMYAAGGTFVGGSEGSDIRTAMLSADALGVVQPTSVPAVNVVVVPEPSAALLGAIGALGLLRRRRN